MSKEATARSAMKLALEALEDIGDEWGFTSKRTLPNRKKAITALREALAEQPAQKRPQNCGTGYCSCIECVVEPAQGEKK